MTSYTATYSPDDNKLRLYASSRLDSETFERAKAAGFRWAPRQELFFAPWTPRGEDLLLDLASEIEDEDKSLVERAEERADRFTDYSAKRSSEANAAKDAVAKIADGIPFGQPILVGHHSEKRARKDAERIQNGMARAVKLWETAGYWTSRAAGAIRAAKYKELPNVRARRIKNLEADKRKRERDSSEAALFLKFWNNLENEGKWKAKDDGTKPTLLERATFIANRDHISRPFTLADFPRDPPASQYEGDRSLWSALDGGIITAEQAKAMAIPTHERTVARMARWITHYENRLAYEKALLAEAGGTIADRIKPEVGGAVRCWAAPGFGKGWAFIKKVNQVSVTILVAPNYGDRLFRQTMPFDKLQAVMSAAQVEEARTEGRLIEDSKGTGFFLQAAPTPDEETSEPAPAAPSVDTTEAADFAAMETSLKAGVKVVTAPQLFPTPAKLAERVIAAANIQPGQRVLEPSAGNGALVAAAWKALWPKKPAIHAIELSRDLTTVLEQRWGTQEGFTVECADFLECNSEIGTFDVIVMNPPFANQQDIAHVTKALDFLKPGGRLVAIMSAGVTFRQDKAATAFRELLEAAGGTIEALPPGSFETSGTGVNAVLVTIDN